MIKRAKRASNYCTCCGKALTDPTSVAVGIGPVCRVESKNYQAAEKTGNLFGNRANFSYTIQGKVVSIVDLNGPKSLTNDMENVLSDIAKAEDICLANYLIMYKDSMGIWDGVIPGPPVGFFSLNERNFSTAKQKLYVHAKK